MNRAKEHRTRSKSPPSDGLFVARRASGALRLIPPSFSRRAPADDQTQRSLRAASPLHAARSSLSPALPVFSPAAPVSGHKKKHVKRRAFLFLRSDAALERNWAAAHRRSMGVSGSKGDRKAAGVEDSGRTHRLKGDPPLQQTPQSLHTPLSPQGQEHLSAFNRIQLQTA